MNKLPVIFSIPLQCDVCVCHQILETIPISEEVSDLVQKLGGFYTEVDTEGEEAEENGVDRRPFTRPFAEHAGSTTDRRWQLTVVLTK